jgi:hypothetical protein
MGSVTKNPKVEGRTPKEDLRPKTKPRGLVTADAFGIRSPQFRVSSLGLLSAFDLRISIFL